MADRQPSSAATACPICGEAHGDECPSVTAEDQKRGYETAAQDRCRAVTVKGDRCKRKALPGSSPELCNEHQLRARRTTQPMVPRWAVAA